MSNKICFNTNIVILVILLFGLLLFLYQNKKSDCKIYPKFIVKHPKSNIGSPDNNIFLNNTPSNVIHDPVSTRDKIEMKDPLVFPEERLDRHNLYLRDKMIHHKIAYAHTQGYPDTPKLRGYLYENSNDSIRRRILPLFGYETYPNSHRFKYHTILNDVGLSIHLAPKIEVEYILRNNNLQKLNKQELYDNDIVQLNNLETAQFTVKLLDRNDDIIIH